eukprot:TRINITY_DN662_c0_g1_i1.p1 TRINITY_DN662_c0_g1~~TRINITY_DN662_c0_g1_i1.p1  ORF type:complete len:663 (+),score=245.40 TRINITY_DN662_c0_g1_i1:60-1991(+)
MDAAAEDLRPLLGRPVSVHQLTKLVRDVWPDHRSRLGLTVDQFVSKHPAFSVSGAGALKTVSLAAAGGGGGRERQQQQRQQQRGHAAWKVVDGQLVKGESAVEPPPKRARTAAGPSGPSPKRRRPSPSPPPTPPRGRSDGPPPPAEGGVKLGARNMQPERRQQAADGWPQRLLAVPAEGEEAAHTHAVTLPPALAGRLPAAGGGLFVTVSRADSRSTVAVAAAGPAGLDHVVLSPSVCESLAVAEEASLLCRPAAPQPARSCVLTVPHTILRTLDAAGARSLRESCAAALRRRRVCCVGESVSAGSVRAKVFAVAATEAQPRSRIAEVTDATEVLLRPEMLTLRVSRQKPEAEHRLSGGGCESLVRVVVPPQLGSSGRWALTVKARSIVPRHGWACNDQGTPELSVRLGDSIPTLREPAADAACGDSVEVRAALAAGVERAHCVTRRATLLTVRLVERSEEEEAPAASPVRDVAGCVAELTRRFAAPPCPAPSAAAAALHSIRFRSAGTGGELKQSAADLCTTGAAAAILAACAPPLSKSSATPPQLPFASEWAAVLSAHSAALLPSVRPLWVASLLFLRGTGFNAVEDAVAAAVADLLQSDSDPADAEAVLLLLLSEAAGTDETRRRAVRSLVAAIAAKWKR